MLKDIIYEEMDELSKMVEPYLSKDNENLSKIPDVIELTFDDIYEYCIGNSNIHGINAKEVLEKKCTGKSLVYVKNAQLNSIRKFFTLKIEDDKRLTVDLKNKTMSAKLLLVKNKEFLTEEEIKEKCLNSLRYGISGSGTGKYFNRKRANEIADLFGATKVKRERGWRGKYHYLKKHMTTIVEDGTLDIRHLDLCGKVGRWIALYIKNGNLAAFKNLTKVKIMSHEKRAIYSIEEEVV